ncbi:MAG: hypothetical protein HY078_15500 [Elusimicrobia bacterium]|nr:hypothetical protein [Elusimicrobiota bacterium]
MNDLATLLRKHPKLLKVLHKHGIHFCAGCFLTLSSAPAKAAAYHGVSDVERFLKDVERASSRKPRHHHPKRRRSRA